MDVKAAAAARFERVRDELVGLSHRIHAHPELGFEEERAAGWLCELLDAQGFTVERKAGGLDTAFVARAGSGPLRIAICCEYDSLPGIGHACGHNVIAASSAGAGIAAAEIADEAGLTIEIVGTPAEEGGGGKIMLLEAGVFDGAHAAMMVHPSPADVVEPAILAVAQLDVRYTGKEAHASMFPEMGINAADALTVAQTAIGLLRQHIRTSDRVHGIVTHGGDMPNIVPASSEAWYMVRARNTDDLTDVRRRVENCFHAGALATGATLELTERHKTYAEMHHDAEIAAHYRANAERLGRRFAEQQGSKGAGSTDMGNVSLALPAIHPMIGIDSHGSANHQAEFAAYCATESADKALADGALAMAWTAIDLAADEPLRTRLLAGAGSGAER